LSSKTWLGVWEPTVLHRTALRATGIVGATAFLLGTGWWLFGSSTHGSKLGRIVTHRFFGRTTSIDMYFPGSRKPVERLVYSWAEPFEQGDPITSCAAIPPARWQDRNHDGQWDTWLLRTGPDDSGECGIEYRVDTTGRGEPDWTFSLPYGQYRHADELIKKRRGFS
jgi:hypothetical protein